ncbi:hypothetical protein AB1P65_09530 [Roseibium alexandrii]
MINDHLRAALRHTGGMMDEATLSRAIERGDYHVINLPNSTVLVEFTQHETGMKTIDFPFCGGDMAELKAIEPQLLEWGRKEGCSKAMAFGRKGWSRVLGYKPVMQIMTKDL